MSNLKISELLDGSSANLDDQIAIARAGVNYELTLGEVKVLVLGTIATDVSNNATAITALQNDRVLRAGDTMTGNLDMGSNKITSTYVPAADADLVNRKYITDNYLPLAGGVMTGAITLHSTGEPVSGSEPVSYTFAEATYAKADGLDGYVARFTPDGNTVKISTLRDDGTTASVNGAVSATAQFLITSSLQDSLNITASGTNGIAITGDFGTNDGFGINSAVANGDTVYNIYGRLPDTNGTITGNYYGVFATGTQTNTGQTIGGDIYGVYGNARHTAGTFGDGAGNGGDLYGVYGQASYSNTTDPMNSLEKMAALYAYSTVSFDATAANGHGVQSQFDVDGTLTNGYSFYAGSSLSSGEITNYHAFYSNGCQAATCQYAYGLKLDPHVATVSKARYGIYQAGTEDKNVYAGKSTFSNNTSFGSSPLVDSYAVMIGGITNSEAAVLRVEAKNSIVSSGDYTISHNFGYINLISSEINGILYGQKNDLNLIVSTVQATEVIGSYSQITHYDDTQTLAKAVGFKSYIQTAALAMTIDEAIAYEIKQTTNIGTINNWYGLKSGGSADNGANYHIYLDAHGSGTAKWGIYQDGANDDNYFAGAIAVGTTNEVANVSSSKGIQINGDDSNKAVLSLDSQSKQNAYIAINHNTSGTGGDQNSLIVFQEDNNTEWMIGLNGTASASTGHRSVAKEFVVSHGDTFDQLADRMLVVQDSSSGPKTVMGIGAEPNPGSVLTLGTETEELEFIEADDSGAPVTQSGFIKVEVGGAPRYIRLYTTIP